jgi:hypothetical protein
MSDPDVPSVVIEVRITIQILIRAVRPDFQHPSQNFGSNLPSL